MPKTGTLPIISLVSDPYNLFDYNHGIYVKVSIMTSCLIHRGTMGIKVIILKEAGMEEVCIEYLMMVC